MHKSVKFSIWTITCTTTTVLYYSTTNVLLLQLLYLKACNHLCSLFVVHIPLNILNEYKCHHKRKWSFVFCGTKHFHHYSLVTHSQTMFNTRMEWWYKHRHKQAFTLSFVVMLKVFYWFYHTHSLPNFVYHSLSDETQHRLLFELFSIEMGRNGVNQLGIL